MFLAHQLYFSRGIFVLTWVCLLAFMLVQRYAFFKFNNYLRRKGFVETTALIYGAGVVGRKLMEKFKQSPKLGYHVAGFIDDNSGLTGKAVLGAPVLGDFTNLRETIRSTRATKLFIALPQVPSKVVVDIMNVCRETGCEFQIVPSLYDIVIQRVKITEVEGIPLIGMAEPKYSFKTRVAKRIFDLFAPWPSSSCCRRSYRNRPDREADQQGTHLLRAEARGPIRPPLPVLQVPLHVHQYARLRGHAPVRQ